MSQGFGDVFFGMCPLDRQILRSAQWGLAAMPAPISYVASAGRNRAAWGRRRQKQCRLHQAAPMMRISSGNKLIPARLADD